MRYKVRYKMRYKCATEIEKNVVFSNFLSRCKRFNIL